MLNNELKKQLDRIKNLQNKNNYSRFKRSVQATNAGYPENANSQQRHPERTGDQAKQLDSRFHGNDETGFAIIENESSIDSGIYPPNILFLNNGKKIDFNLDKTLFFDIETTSLSQGAGNVPFLIGFAYFNNITCTFRTKQFLLLDYPHERKMLADIHFFMDSFDHFVSFNGKSFDLPLINGRFLLHDFNAIEREHWDLLYTSRNIWKGYLDSCSLSSIEKNILNVVRNNDIPSYAIPERYFAYLETQNLDILTPIVIHNRIDIESMVILINTFFKIYTAPISFGNLNHYYLGKQFILEKEFEKATLCLKKAILTATDEQIKKSIEKLLRKVGKINE